MKGEKLTVVTVCRNVREQLRLTMASVAEQTYGEIEYVVVDGASDDGSTELIEGASFPGEYRWVSERDKGIYDAMNKGAAMATGEWILFMNAGDCFADKNTVARLMAGAPADADVVYGDVIKRGPDGTEYVKKASAMADSHRMLFCHQSAMVRRELMLRHPYDLKHRFSADFKFFKTLFKEGRRFVKLDMAVARFDTGGVSNTQRSRGLADNISVVAECDGFPGCLRHLVHLLPPYVVCRLRGK